MIAAITDDWPLTNRAERTPAADAGLFALIDELRRRERHRDQLLEQLAVRDDDGIAPEAKNACDAARVIFERIAAIKPTTAAGVLRQLELTANGWIGASTVPIAMAALREISTQPPPLKVGRLPPVPRFS
jgi:hypothetical protein